MSFEDKFILPGDDTAPANNSGYQPHGKTKLTLPNEMEGLGYYLNVRCQYKSKLDSAMALRQPVGTDKAGRNGCENVHLWSDRSQEVPGRPKVRHPGPGYETV